MDALFQRTRPEEAEDTSEDGTVEDKVKTSRWWWLGLALIASLAIVGGVFMCTMLTGTTATEVDWKPKIMITLGGPHDGFGEALALEEDYLAVGGCAYQKLGLYTGPDFKHHTDLSSTWATQSNCVTSLAVTEDFLAAGSEDGKVRLYTRPDFMIHTTLTVPMSDSPPEGYPSPFRRNIYGLAFTRDFLAVGGGDGKVRIYARPLFQLHTTLTDATDRVWNLAFAEDFLAAGSEDRKVRIYTLPDFKLHTTLTDATDRILTLAVRDNFLAAGGGDGKVRLYTLPDFKLHTTLTYSTEEGHEVRALAIREDFLAAGGNDWMVRTYTRPGFKLNATLTSTKDFVNALAFTKDSLAVLGEMGNVSVYSL